MVDFKPIEGVPYAQCRHDYVRIFRDLHKASRDRAIATYRALCREDLFFLLYFCCGKHFINTDYRTAKWWVDRINEVETGPATGTLDIWSRATGKSTVITFGDTMQRILRDANQRIAIFSYNRAEAKKFLREHKLAFESNMFLQMWFPEIVWTNPKRQSPKWSEDEGLFLRRSSTAREGTLEAWGLTDSQPTGRHFTHMVYDDVVTQEAVRTPGAFELVANRFSMSKNLGADRFTERVLGTRYDFSDLYGDLIEKAEAGDINLHIRVRPVVEDWPDCTRCHLWTADEIRAKESDMRQKGQGSFVFACSPAEAPILMADFTEKPISEVAAGDEIIGFSLGTMARRTQMEKATVKAVHRRRAVVQKMVLDNGDVIRCTPEHRWWTGRGPNDPTHPVYAPAKIGRKLRQFIDRNVANDPGDPVEMSYLAGMLDGEGSLMHGSIAISQSEDNMAVCDRIEQNLNSLGIQWNVHTRRKSDNWKHSPVRMYYMLGGKSQKIRLIRHCKGLAKRDQLFGNMWKHPVISAKGGLRHSRVVSIEIGSEPEDVYALETTTGNYFVWGYASSNSQVLCNPVDPENAPFKPEHLRYWTALPEGSNHWPKYLLVDPAGWDERGQASGGDSAAFVVVGVDPEGKWYVLDLHRGRYNPKKCVDLIFSLDEKWDLRLVGIEKEKYGKTMKWFLEQEMTKRGWPLKIEEIPVGGRSKHDKIMGLQALYESGMLIVHPDQRQLIEEFRRFPGWSADDCVDALSSGLHIIPKHKPRTAPRREALPTARNRFGSW